MLISTNTKWSTILLSYACPDSLDFFETWNAWSRVNNFHNPSWERTTIWYLLWYRTVLTRDLQIWMIAVLFTRQARPGLVTISSSGRTLTETTRLVGKARPELFPPSTLSPKIIDSLKPLLCTQVWYIAVPHLHTCSQSFESVSLPTISLNILISILFNDSKYHETALHSSNKAMESATDRYCHRSMLPEINNSRDR